MSYVIAAPCIADYSCVPVCPVNAIGPDPASAEFDEVEQLYIDPVACIRCGACKDMCPVGAIFEAGCLPPHWEHYAEVNRLHFAAEDESA